MYRFVIGNVILSSDGELDARGEALSGGCFLLSHTGKVLFARSATDLPLVGEQFFEALGTVKGERDVLEKTLLQGAREPYLMQCGKTPVLLFRQSYPGNLTLLAVIPPKAVAEALKNPAPYADLLGYYIKLSPLSLAAQAEPDERLYRLMSEWLQAVMPVAGGTLTREEQARQLASVLQRRLCVMARFTGVLVQYDFSALSYGTVTGLDDALLVAMLAAVFCSLSPLARDRVLHIAAVRDSLGEPRLHIRIYTAEKMPPEGLAALLQSLAPRGMTWECYRDPTIAELWHIVLPLCAKELSLQQLRNYFGY